MKGQSPRVAGITHLKGGRDLRRRVDYQVQGTQTLFDFGPRSTGEETRPPFQTRRRYRRIKSRSAGDRPTLRKVQRYVAYR